MKAVPTAVLASGSGSNFQAVADYFRAQGDDAAAEIVALVSDRANAPAMGRARKLGIPAVHIADPAAPDGLAKVLRDHGAELVVLAGYLRLIPAPVVRDFADRILNVHPSLLPQFGGPGMYGMRVHQAVIASRAGRTGVTVHLVNEEFDRGAILAQWPVPIIQGDTAESLAKRVLAVEHVLYPMVIEAFARGRVTAANPFQPSRPQMEMLAGG